MSGSEPGGAREKEQEKEGEAGGGRGLCVCVLLSFNMWEEEEEGGGSLTFCSAAGLRPYLDLTRSSASFFHLQQSCFNLIWLQSKRPLGLLGPCLVRPCLFRDRQHVYRAFYLFSFASAAARICLILSLTSVSQRKSIASQHTFLVGFAKKSNNSTALRNGAILQQAMDLFHYTATARVVEG